MAQSLSPECTPLKLRYDSCFNAWLESYLSPEVTASVSPGTSKNASNEDAKAQRTRRMAQEYESKCGAAWTAYNTCVTRAVKEHKLEELINQAREENPLRELESHVDRTHSP